VISRGARLCTGFATALFAVSAPAHADCPEGAPWHHLSDTAARLVTPAPLALGVVSVATPLAMAPGADHRLRLVAQRDLGGRPNLEPVSVIAPYALGGALAVGYTVSAALGACAWQKPQAAVLQALVLGVTFGSALKGGVGRQWPNGGRDPRAPDRLEHPDQARDFRPFRRFGAWPSGHTLAMMAAASAFRTSTPELGVVSWVGYPLALGVAGGMWLGDHHWASDIVSGALLGEAIGESVGPSFAEHAHVPGTLGFLPTHGGALVTWGAEF
jgi:membrane-associated phospholipid phosphatase